MPISFIPFDGWKPSAGYFGDGWAGVSNLAPFYGDWRPMKKFIPAASTAAFGPMAGSHVHLWTAGAGTASYAGDQGTLFTGSKTRLFTVDGVSGAFTDVSKAALYGGGAAQPAGWRFASVGNDIWATNWTDPLQRRTNNAGLFADGVVSTFKPLPRHIAVIREHMGAANLSNAGRFQDEFVWSDADDATNFDPPTLTSTSIAGGKRLISIPGQITGLVGGQYGLAFKRSSIFYLEYAGPPGIFRPDVLSAYVGTMWGSSIIKSRYGLFFLGADGFYDIAGLAEPTKISSPGIDQFLLDTNTSLLPTGLAVDEDTQVQGFQFTELPLVGWAVRKISQEGSFYVLYNPATGEWSQGNLSFTGGTGVAQVVSALFHLPSTLVYGSLAAVSFDNAVSRFAPLAANGAAGGVQAPVVNLQFRPANLDSTGQHGQSLVKGILPVFSKTSPTASPLTYSVTVESYRDPNGSPTTEGPRAYTLRNPVGGWYPFQSAGRFFRITINCAAEDFSNFDGVWIDQEPLK